MVSSQKSQKLSIKQAFFRFFKLIKPYWFLLLLSIIFSSIASIFSGAIAWGVKPLFDKIFLPQNYKYITFLPFILIGIFFVRGSAVFLQSYFIKKASYSLGNNLRIKIYEKLLNLPLHYADQRQAGDLISRIINDTLILENMVGDITRTIFLEIPTILVLIGIAFYRSWKLTLLTFLVFPLVIYTSKILAKKTHKKRTDVQEKLAELTQLITESIKGLKEIKVYLQEKRMFEKFCSVAEDCLRSFLKLVKYNEGTKTFVTFFTGIAGGIILFYGGNLIKSGEITPGDFFSLFTAILMVFNPLKRLASTYNRFHECIVGIERIEEILNLPKEDTGDLRIDGVVKGFNFYEVSFKYPGSQNYALKGINLEIPAGKVIAIIGKSGAGKSTLVSLLPRFYDPTEGFITVDGIDLRKLDVVALRKLFGIVSQEVVIFNMSIAENIAFGKPGASMEEIIRAAKLAYAHEFIKELPKGYDTVIGEKGFSFSGGQKQRIAIARAILKDPPVLILDEATSQLDTISEKYIQKALENLMKNRTTIIIAHRLSTVKNADIVVVLKEGKVVGVGTHKELEKSCSEYQELFKFLEK